MQGGQRVSTCLQHLTALIATAKPRNGKRCGDRGRAARLAPVLCVAAGLRGGRKAARRREREGGREGRNPDGGSTAERRKERTQGHPWAPCSWPFSLSSWTARCPLRLPCVCSVGRAGEANVRCRGGRPAGRGKLTCAGRGSAAFQSSCCGCMHGSRLPSFLCPFLFCCEAQLPFLRERERGSAVKTQPSFRTVEGHEREGGAVMACFSCKVVTA